ncbi:hypothetical protein ACJIZ3_021981 [Penstemon smallii]|uniref:DUF7953 domain-containing protein n=1 Tax=Penstemon smallii TaxID=265156 RepID=A0ABD3SNV7_9LAMI
MTRRRFKHRIPCVLLLLCSILLSYFPVLISAAVVTLDSIEISRTHEWLPSQPTIYFQCKGASRTVLPDVKEKHVLYTFKGEESWQPLTEFRDIKCKRCGFYEKDTIKTDHVFDEWEFCPSDFTRADGKYLHFKDEEFNATFLCPECVTRVTVSDQSSKPISKPVSEPTTDSNRMHWIIIVVISVSVSVVFIISFVITYKYCQKRKRQQEQARFLRLFEEGDDDLEDELGIGPLSHSI